MSAKTNSVDLRVMRTRQLLEESFLALMEEKGFQSVTAQDITNRDTINRATYYAHFEDKYALLDHVIGKSFRNSLSEKLSADAEFSFDNLRLLLFAVYEYMSWLNRSECFGSNAQFNPLIEKQVQRVLFHIVSQWIEQLQADNSPLQPSTESTASAVSWTIFGAGLHRSRTEQKPPTEEISNQIIALLLGGLNGIYELGMAQR